MSAPQQRNRSNSKDSISSTGSSFRRTSEFSKFEPRFQTIQLSISANDLIIHDPSNPRAVNPFAVAYIERSGSDEREILDFTDIMSDVSPMWGFRFNVDYFFSSRQRIIVEIYNARNEDRYKLDDHLFVGEAVFDLSITFSRGSQVSPVLPRGQSGEGAAQGVVTLKADATTANMVFGFTPTASNLPPRSKIPTINISLTKSDPYAVLQLMNQTADGKVIYTDIWKSKMAPSTTEPKWKRSVVSISAMKASSTGKCRFVVYDNSNPNDPTSHRVIGTTDDIDPESFLNKASEDLVLNTGHRRRSVFHLEACKVSRHHTFYEYIRGGCEISLMVAIDFSGSNRDPIMPDSLHYLDPTHRILNDYEKAILATGNVLSPFDSDNLYQVFGFGCRLKDKTGKFEGVPNHCFSLTDKSVHGVRGILEAYRATVKDVKFHSGPSTYRVIFQKAREIASALNCTQEKQKYAILLLLTDGVLTDKQETILEIIRATKLPLSVVIVGVGEADFSDMVDLDGDRNLLRTDTEIAERDIVQFVKLREFIAADQPFDRSKESVLAEQLLAEIPTQLVTYMLNRNILPNNLSS